jgi:hypothetical protein
MEMFELRKGEWDRDVLDFAPERTLSFGAEGWDPERTDVDLLVMEDVEEDDLKAVIERPVWKGLKALRLKAFRLEDRAMAVLGMEGAFADLQHLDLHACYRVADYTLAALAGAAPRLKSLCIDWSEVTDVGLMTLLRDDGPALDHLRGIHLKNVTRRGLMVVHQSTRVGNAHLTAPAEPT